MSEATIRDQVELRRSLGEPAERRRAREILGLPADVVGNAVGVTGEAIRNWERGTRTPRAAHLAAYAEALAEMRALALAGLDQQAARLDPQTNVEPEAANPEPDQTAASPAYATP